MCKKLILAAVAILVGTAVVKHTSVGSLAQVWWRDAKQAVERAVPPEVQIKRLANEVSKIDADIKQNLSRLAQQEVDTQKLDDEVASLKDKQVSLRADISAMTKALESGTERVSFNGKSLRPATAAHKLDVATQNYERQKAELKSKESLLTTKREGLEAAHARIAEMSSQKEQLRTTVGELEAQLQLVRLNATRNNANVELDDSQVARCKQLASEIRERLAVQTMEQKLDAKYGYSIPVPKFEEETKPTADVLKAAKKAIEDETDRVAADK
jgi:chromosome segregation ATPase